MQILYLGPIGIWRDGFCGGRRTGEPGENRRSKAGTNKKLNHVWHQGPVSRKPRKLSGPVKPFFVDLNVKTEKCIRLKLLV